eukprot:4000346-Pyramimonas_sp.AAC.1
MAAESRRIGGRLVREPSDRMTPKKSTTAALSGGWAVRLTFQAGRPEAPKPRRRAALLGAVGMGDRK